MGAQTEVRPGSAKTDMEVGAAQHVEALGVFEMGLVAISGLVVHDDLVAHGEGLTAQGSGFGDGAAHVYDGTGVAHDFINRGRRDTVEVGRPDRSLIGVFREIAHAVGDRVARGLVAGHEQQDEEPADFGACQFLAVDLGVHEHRRQIFGRVLLSLVAMPLNQADEVVRGTHEGGEEVGELGGVFRVFCAKNHARLFEHELVLVVGDADHVADHFEWERGRDIVHEVTFTTGLHGVDDLGGNALDRLFNAAQDAGSEAAAHQAPQPGMARVVHGDDRLENVPERLGPVESSNRAHAVGVNLRVARDLVDVIHPHRGIPSGRLGHAREYGCLVEREAGRASQFGERFVALGQWSTPKRRLAEVDDIGSDFGH